MGKLTEWIAYINGDLAPHSVKHHLVHFTVGATEKRVRKLLKQPRINMEEKTGFEGTQELPISDKEIIVILDSLRNTINLIEQTINDPVMTNQIRILLMERQKSMQQIIDKLNNN